MKQPGDLRAVLPNAMVREKSEGQPLGDRKREQGKNLWKHSEKKPDHDTPSSHRKNVFKES